MNERSLKGKVAIVGVGETRYYKRGASPDPEFRMALKAIMAAATDAGIDVRDIDGFASFHDERSQPTRLANALGVHALRFSNLVWGEAGAVGRLPWEMPPPPSWQALRTASWSIARLYKAGLAGSVRAMPHPPSKAPTR